MRTCSIGPDLPFAQRRCSGRIRQAGWTRLLSKVGAAGARRRPATSTRAPLRRPSCSSASLMASWRARATPPSAIAATPSASIGAARAGPDSASSSASRAPHATLNLLGMVERGAVGSAGTGVAHHGAGVPRDCRGRCGAKCAWDWAALVSKSISTVVSKVPSSRWATLVTRAPRMKASIYTLKLSSFSASEANRAAAFDAQAIDLLGHGAVGVQARRRASPAACAGPARRGRTGRRRTALLTAA